MKEKSVTKLTVCRICKSSRLEKFLDLGKMPLPNGFLKAVDLNKKEPQFNLVCTYCTNCSLVQLSEVVNPKIMFNNYMYIPSGAKSMMNNFDNLSLYAQKKLNINSDSFVVDIGSNDGSLLKSFKRQEARVLGIDPAKNLITVARLNGIPTETGMFNTSMARKVVKKYGQADLVTATNVIAHIDNLDEVFKGIKILLKKDGSFITEFPYILDLITKNQFDTIYHEHLSYFGLTSWNRLIEQNDFQIVDVFRLPIHGGSIRVVHKSRDPNTSIKKSKRVASLINLEAKQGLADKKTYAAFRHRTLSLKNELQSLLKSLKKQKKNIIGLGAPAKGSILTCFLDIGKETLDYIVDSTSFKQGLFTPKKHIPIYPEERVLQSQPDYALILAWNFKEEIMRKHKLFKKRGGKFIIPIPEIKII